MTLPDLDPEELEAQFNPRVAVPDAQGELDRWVAWSADLNRTVGGRCDLSYGDHPSETFDLHLATNPSPETPMVVFIHGGFWRSLDKAQQRFVPQALNSAGRHCINLNYPLCPGVSLTELNQSLNRALRFILDQSADWCMGDSPLILMGHSAGAHAAAMLMSDPEISGEIDAVVAISGIYDTRIVRHTSINADVRLDEQEAEAMNALAMKPTVHCPVLITVGADEPEHWRDQSRQWADWLRQNSIEPQFVEEPNCHHFRVLEAACGLVDGARAPILAWP